MPINKYHNSQRIEIDLSALRATAERKGQLTKHSHVSCELGENLKKYFFEEEYILHHDVQFQKMKIDNPIPKSLGQVIEVIGISLAPIGALGLAKITIKLIEICRTKIPTTYEAEIPNVGKFKVTGPKIKLDDLITLIEESRNRLLPNTKVKIYSPEGEALKIRALP